MSNRLNLLPVSSAALLLLFAGTSCTMAPDYTRPSLPVPENAETPEENGDLQLSQVGWRDFFRDPRLVKLIELALENNRDLRVAILNIEKDRAQYRIQRAALLPTIGASLSTTREKAIVFTKTPSFVSEYNATIGVTSFELDLFGRVQSLKNQALELWRATLEDRKSAQISLISQVASSYLTLLADEEILQLTQDFFASQQTTYDLTLKSFDVGSSSEVELRQAEADLESARANVAKQKQIVEQDRHALVLLVGISLPQDLPQGVSLANQKILARLPAGIKSEVLLKRPDILSAEHQLQAANANIGAARAAFFPSISLTGNWGFSSLQLNSLFAKNSQSWSFVPTINLPLFTGGQNLANLDLSETNKGIAVANYEKAIQTAFKEVSDALTARKYIEEQLKADFAYLNANQKSFNIAELRYQQGIDNYQSALATRRTFLMAQQTVTSDRLSSLNNMITIYKVLGGGWTENTEKQN